MPTTRETFARAVQDPPQPAGPTPVPEQIPSIELPTRYTAVKICTWYATLGFVWILGSSSLLHYFVHDSDWAAILETVKGWAFILVTALILGLSLDRYFRRIRSATLQIQSSETRLRQLGNHLPQGYVYQYTHDEQGRPAFAYLSAGVQALHGLTPDEIVADATRLLDQIEPAQRSLFLAAERESARTLAEFEMEVAVQRPDGAKRVVLLRSRPRRNAVGSLEWDGLALDVTQRCRELETIRQYAGAFEHCAHGIAVGRPGVNELITCNPAFARLLGRTVEELKGLGIVALYAPEEHERVRMWISEADRVGQVQYHTRFRRGDGSVFPAQVDLVSVRDAEGKPQYRVALVQETVSQP